LEFNDGLKRQLLDAGANRLYLLATVATVQTLMALGHDFDSVVARWKVLKPEWFTAHAKKSITV
jgi:hypothetical protein